MVVNFKFEHGQKVKDKVSGVSGIINAMAIWINGCNRYSVQPKAKKNENKIPDSYWIDEQQLELVKSKDVPVKKTFTGGPSSCSTNDKY